MRRKNIILPLFAKNNNTINPILVDVIERIKSKNFLYNKRLRIKINCNAMIHKLKNPTLKQNITQIGLKIIDSKKEKKKKQKIHRLLIVIFHEY